MLIIALVDMFANLWKFLAFEAPLLGILQVSVYYLPKCASFALPIAILFAVAFTLGNLRASSELLAIFSSGTSLRAIALPLIIISLLISIGSFFFEDGLVIPSLKQKDYLTKTLLKQKPNASNSNITLISRSGTVLWRADFYYADTNSLSGVIIVYLDTDGSFISRLNAQSAVWNGKTWDFTQVRRFYWNADKTHLTDSVLSTYSQVEFNENPESFKRSTANVQEMQFADAAYFVERLKKSGFPYYGELAELQKRIAFSLTPLIVVLLSCFFGGRFKKNIMLMSLISSLSISVIYYVIQMITMLMAKFEMLNPYLGAWLPFILFSILSVGMLFKAKT